jgi:hypothetical protein
MEFISSINSKIKDDYLPVISPCLSIVDNIGELIQESFPKASKTVNTLQGATALVGGISAITSIVSIPEEFVELVDSCKCKDIEGTILSILAIAEDFFGAITSSLSFAEGISKLGGPALPKVVTQIMGPVGICASVYTIASTVYGTFRRFQVLQSLDTLNAPRSEPLSKRQIKVLDRHADKKIAKLFEQNCPLTAGELDDCKTLMHRKLILDGVKISTASVGLAVSCVVIVSASTNPTVLATVFIGIAFFELGTVLYEQHLLYEGLDHLNYKYKVLKLPPPPPKKEEKEEYKLSFSLRNL